MTNELAKRWWMDPGVAYLHRLGTDVQVIPLLSKTSKEYAVAKNVARINRGNMSEDYYKLQREGDSSSKVLSMIDLAEVFHQYLNRLCNDGHDVVVGLIHIITRFTGMYKWPIPIEHFRINY
jgi:hypothetical protein